jgi:hypothetical protein
MKNKIKRGFLPIYSKDIRRLIGYCDTWDYGNKDTCKYVAEQVMEILANDYKININPIGINNPLWSELISLTHDINSGGKFYNIKNQTERANNE